MVDNDNDGVLLSRHANFNMLALTSVKAPVLAHQYTHKKNPQRADCLGQYKCHDTSFERMG